MTRPTALRYARSLWASGFPALAIGLAVEMDARRITRIARRQRWIRSTPVRHRAGLEHRHPVRVRCGSCFAIYGDVAGDTRRPCPRCDGTQLVFPSAACWTVEARA